ncbi:TniQ family protein [Paraburkholderia agricolaris]|uniref:TniQ family protein n=1 Tax=Paraburkholderia agricolaris TaxID=2152888 RepID=A0ABW8ZZS6_9BURK
MKLSTAPTSMMMTTIVDGEYLPLYPARLRSFACADVMPKSWLFPSGMLNLIDQLADFVGPLDKVLARNTLLPLFHRALVPDNQAFVTTHFLEAPKMGLPAIVGLNGPRSGWARATVARCPRCIQEDIAPCGNPFWRRDHLIPGLLFCSRHRLPLHIPCEKCADFKAHPNLTTHPGMHCGCGLRPLPQTTPLSGTDVASEIEMANGASKLLEPSYLPNLNHIGIATLVARSTNALGLVKDSRVDWRRAVSYLKDARHANLLSRTSLPLHRDNSVGSVLRGETVFRHPLHNIALLIALYGTWSAVEAEGSLLTGEERPTAPASGQPKVRPKTGNRKRRIKWLEKNHSRWFSHYVEMYREAQRKHTADGHMELMRRLPQNAGMFLNREKLLAAGVDVPTRAKYIGVYDDSLDRSFSRHIRATAKRLVKQEYQGRLSRRVLTRGHRMDMAWFKIYGRLPRARRAIAACEESLTDYKRRRLLMLAKTGLVFGFAGLTEEQIDWMDDKTVAELLKQGVVR